MSHCRRSGQTWLQSCRRVHCSQTMGQNKYKEDQFHTNSLTAEWQKRCQQEVGYSTDLSIMLLLHCSSLTKISISSFRWCILEQKKKCFQTIWATLSILHTHTHAHTQRHTPGHHLVLGHGCDSRLFSSSIRLQTEKHSV